MPLCYQDKRLKKAEEGKERALEAAGWVGRPAHRQQRGELRTGSRRPGKGAPPIRGVGGHVYDRQALSFLITPRHSTATAQDRPSLLGFKGHPCRVTATHTSDTDKPFKNQKNLCENEQMKKPTQPFLNISFPITVGVCVRMTTEDSPPPSGGLPSRSVPRADTREAGKMRVLSPLPRLPDLLKKPY